MARYFSRPRSFFVADDVYVEPATTIPTVSDHEAIDTGLLDADGNPIYRAPNPIGFGKDDDW